MTRGGTVQATFCATLVDEWVRAGVAHAVLAPGSRSTPLALALAADDRITLHVHLDERSAAFFALGIGMATGRPAVVLTTSGSAALHLHAAVVEASHARVPLLACTADRPPALHHVGAPQTIEQVGLYGGAARWALDVGVADDRERRTWRSIASRAVAEALTGGAGPGPVHLNLAFDEPLVAEPDACPPGRPGGEPWHATAVHGGAPADGVLDSLLVGRRGVIVAGGGAGEPEEVHALAARLGWPVLADPRSGCRGVAGAVAAFDAIVRTGAAPAPDVVLRLGQLPASKVLGQWLAALEADTVLVDPYGGWADPDRVAGTVVRADPAAVCAGAACGASPVADDWRRWWLDADARAQQAIDRVLDGHPEPTDPGVARTLTRVVPPEGTLFVASSMPVRDVEWFGDAGARQQVLANRGANGIDGLVSTALGVAAGRRDGASVAAGRRDGASVAAGRLGPVVAHLGDLAFLHDSTGLLGARRRAEGCTFVVTDNDGGAIFSFLPQAAALSPARFEQLFGTPHEIDLAALASVHGLSVAEPTTAADVGPAVRAGIEAGDTRLVLVRTDRRANVALHDELNRAVADALG